VARTTFRGVAYRVTHPDYEDLERTMEVGREHPGRFNPLGTGAIYVSLERETAVAELRRRAALLALPPAALAPRAVFTLEIVLRQVLDLTDESVRAEWDVTLADLRSDDHARCHEVATVARRDGFAAIRFPSATGRGENLAVFHDQRHTGSYVELRRKEELDLGAP
jgi:RES domain-containing protein